jgi:3-hydroxybutyryl-CoA dehydratase
MSRPAIPSRIPARFEVGQKVSFTRTFTETDMVLFIGVTWDINPYHTDEQFAAQTKFGKRILPGLLTASMGTHLGGLWGFLAQEMTMEFVAPVYIGDTITIVGEVVEVDPRGRVRVKTRYTNTAGQEVLRGEFSGYPSPVAPPQNGGAE